jgi:hypothetical protein
MPPKKNKKPSRSGKIVAHNQSLQRKANANPFGLPTVGQQFRPFSQRPPASTSSLRDTVPDTVHLPMRYVDDYDQSGTVINDLTLNLNSIFDPDRSGVGHQPLGYDQWALFYNRYRVDTVDIQVDFVNLSTTSVTDVLVHCSNDATAITTNAQFLANSEAPFTEVTLLSTSNGNNIWSIKRRISLNQITGISAEKYRVDDVYSAQFGSNPSEVIVAHICGKDFTFTTNIQLKTRVTLTFWCTLFDRLQLAISMTKPIKSRPPVEETDEKTPLLSDKSSSDNGDLSQVLEKARGYGYFVVKK